MLLVIAGLAAENPPCVKDLVAVEGLLAAVVEAAKNNAGLGRMNAAFIAMWNLGSHEGVALKMALYGGVTVLLEKLMEDDSDVIVENAVGALSTLTYV